MDQSNASLIAQPLLQQTQVNNGHLNPIASPGLVDSIETNVEIITNSIFSHLAQPHPAHQKLIVGFGELHETGSHVIIEAAVVDRLAKAKIPCAFAVEWPPNNIDLHIDDEMSSATTDKARLKDLLALPGYASIRNKLSADTTPIRSSNARLSRTVLHEYLDNHGVPVFCADAPRDWELFLKYDRVEQHLLMTDPKGKYAIQEAAELLHISPGPDGFLPVSSLKQFGMLARNLYIYNEAMDILEKAPHTQVVFLQVGRAHVVGNDSLKPESSPFEHGLSHIFAKKWQPNGFLGAAFYSSAKDRENTIPSLAYADPTFLNLVDVENVAFNVVSSDTADKRETAHIKSLAPFFPFISETLGDKSPVELREHRKEALLHSLEEVRDTNGLDLHPDLVPH